MARSYELLEQRLASVAGDRAERLQAVVDVLWDTLHETGVSWVGFYYGGEGDEMTLGPRRDKPACSPIGLHGACGQAFTQRRPLVVHNVADLGEGYIACDPRDRSEVVLPMFDESGRCWGVLDVDSHDVGAFAETDVAGLQKVCMAAGITHGRQDWC